MKDNHIVGNYIEMNKKGSPGEMTGWWENNRKVGPLRVNEPLGDFGYPDLNYKKYISK